MPESAPTPSGTILLHGREKFVRGTNNQNAFALQRLEARNASGAGDIKQNEARKLLQRFEAYGANGTS